MGRLPLSGFISSGLLKIGAGARHHIRYTRSRVIFKPLLQHLQFTGRLRRSDLIATIDDFHHARSVIAPSCQLLYRPREVNFIADFLAGQGSKFLLDLHKQGLDLPGGPTRISATPPIPLLLKQQAILFGTHRAGQTVMCLVERVTCTMSRLVDVTRHPDEYIGTCCPVEVRRSDSSRSVKTKMCKGLFPLMADGDQTCDTQEIDQHQTGHLLEENSKKLDNSSPAAESQTYTKHEEIKAMPMHNPTTANANSSTCYSGKRQQKISHIIVQPILKVRTAGQHSTMTSLQQTNVKAKKLIS